MRRIFLILCFMFMSITLLAQNIDYYNYLKSFQSGQSPDNSTLKSKYFENTDFKTYPKTQNDFQQEEIYNDKKQTLSKIENMYYQSQL